MQSKTFVGFPFNASISVLVIVLRNMMDFVTQPSAPSTAQSLQMAFTIIIIGYEQFHKQELTLASSLLSQSAEFIGINHLPLLGSRLLPILW